MLNFLEFLIKKVLDIFFPQSDIVRKLEMLVSHDELSTLPKPDRNFSSNITSLFSYKNKLIRELVWQIKYKRNKNLTRAVGKILYEVILGDISDKTFFESGIFLLVPIPMTKKRKNGRGYNQAEDIAASIMQFDQQKILVYAPQVLVKTRETKSQTKTENKNERLENLKDSLAIPNPENVNQKIVILVDDVITTGSTINTARKVLEEAGAKNIYVYTIAH